MSLVNLRQILKGTRAGKYAVGAFNFNGYEDAQGIINGAVAKQSPVILMASMSVVKYFGLKQVVGLIKGMAESVDIPVCLHLDHCTSVELCKDAVVCGFTSIMYDGSALPFDENVKNTTSVVEFARKYGVSVEAEIGHVGGIEDGVGTDEYNKNLTQPDEAVKFYGLTKTDALAVAIGTVHGFYKSEPHINFENLTKIASALDVPLVLHGGTGVSDEDIMKSISCGMSKINVGTELKATYSSTVRKYSDEVEATEIDPKKIVSHVKDACSGVVQKHIDIFGSANKA